MDLKKYVLQKVEFRQGVAKHNNVKDLVTDALTYFIAPGSNAIVEGILSLVTAIKTKPHNKTQIKLLDAHVRISTHLISNAICYKDFECTANMIKLHKSVYLYGQNESSTINDDVTEYLENILH